MTNASAAFQKTNAPIETQNDNEKERSYTAHKVTFTASEIDSDNMVQTIASRLMKAHPYDVCITRYQRGDGYNVQEAKDIANKILTARLANEDPDFGEFAQDCWEDEYDSAHTLLHEFLDKLREDYIDNVDDDEEETSEIERLVKCLEDDESEIIDSILELASCHDDSSPEDLFYPNDYCEIALIFMPPEGAWDDYMFCQGHEYYAGLEINERSTDVLRRLGHTLTDYRKHSGNTSKSYGLSRRPVGTKILELDQLRQIAEEASSSYFLVVAYAHVPLSQLLKIDFTQPVTLEKWAVASWNPDSGTFFDLQQEDPLIAPPGIGRWVIPGATGYSPDDICGMVSRYYQSDLTNG